MHWVLGVAVALLLWGAVPAHGARVWSDPVPVAAPAPAYAEVAVGPDGTTIAAWTADLGAAGGFTVFASVNGRAQALGTTGAEAVFVAGGSGGNGVVAWSNEAAGVSLASLAQPDGTFAAPQIAGEGAVEALQMNAAGDAVILLQRTIATSGVGYEYRNTTAFRPAGGAFGPPAELPRRLFAGFALGADGEQLIGISNSPMDGPALGLDVYRRVRDGAITGPDALAGDAVNASLHLDGAGRALAVWTDQRGVLSTAVRPAGGAWGAPAPLAEARRVLFYRADVGPGGEAVIAWREPLLPTDFSFEPGGGALEAVTGSLSDGAFAAPAVLDPAAGTDPFVAVGPGGTALVASRTPSLNAVRVMRRDGTGAFGAPQVAACAARHPLNGIAGLTDAGDAALLVGTGVVRDHPGDAVPDRTCPAGEGPVPVSVAYNPAPVIAGEPATITPSVRRPDFNAPTSYAFDFDNDGLAEVPTGAVPSVVRIFPSPGLNRFSVTTRQTAAPDGPRTVFTDEFTLDVLARATLRAAKRQPRRRVVRRGLVVQASAFTGRLERRVVLRLRARGRGLGRRAVRAGFTPVAVRVRPTRAGRRLLKKRRATRVRVQLVQDGRVLRSTRVRVRARR